jgi:transcription initiation factor TFIID subunit 12
MMPGQNIANGLQARPTSQDQQQAVNPSIAAAQQQMRASMTPPINGQQQQIPSHLNQTLPTFTQQQSQPFNLQRPLPNPTQAAQLKFPTPPTNLAPGSLTGQSPVPLTHQGAIAAAGRTYSQQTLGGVPQAPSTSGSFSGRANDLDKTSNKYPTSFNKGWTPQTPQPVSMGAARPTLTGPQSGPMGMMGQPAIQKQPPFLLQGQGDRVLDKKKLDELVRQVTGGSGEGLQPEVEEVSISTTTFVNLSY